MQEPAPAHNANRCVHYGYVVLGLVILVVFSALGLARFGYTSILPAMQEALHLTNSQTGALQSWNLVGYLVTVVFAGILAARFGPRAIMDFVHRADGQGCEGVLIHCKAGISRSAAIAKWIAEQHRGEINVTSELGQGSSFRVLLPLIIPQESASTPATIHPPTVSSRSR